MASQGYPYGPKAHPKPTNKAQDTMAEYFPFFPDFLLSFLLLSPRTPQRCKQARLPHYEIKALYTLASEGMCLVFWWQMRAIDSEFVCDRQTGRQDIRIQDGRGETTTLHGNEQLTPGHR